MLVTRIAKAVMIGSLAAFALVVSYDNVVDYNSNYQFVRHVLSMDTTFPNNALLDRAIHQPWMWQIAYVAIIATEGLTGVVFAIGAIALLRNLRAASSRFHYAKRFAVVGAGLGFLLWFLGFMVVGGEWFAMWQSATWNGQQAAFRFYMTILAVLIFVVHPDQELEA